MIQFVFLCLTFLVQCELIFPTSSESYQQWQWISCETGETQTSITSDGAQQYSLTESDGLCSSPQNSLILKGQDTLIYSFIFNVKINTLNNLTIYLDGKRYIISAYDKDEKTYVTIKHKHFESCLTSIDITLGANQGVNLVYFYIQNHFSQSQDKQIPISPSLSLPLQTKDCFRWQTNSQSIKNNIYYYTATVNQTFCLYEGLITKRVQCNGQTVTPTFIEIGQQQYEAFLEVALSENIKKKLNNLPFLFLSEYYLEYWWLGTYENIADQSFSIVSQIDENSNTINSNFLWYEKSGNEIQLILEHDIEMNVTEQMAQIQIMPKSYPICNYTFSYAQIVFYNGDQTYQECDFTTLHLSNLTCLTYSNDNCTFSFVGNFSGSAQFYFNLTALIKDTNPRVYYQITNQVITVVRSQESHLVASIVMFVILTLFVSPLIIFLYYFIFKPRYYIMVAYFLPNASEDEQ